jgi:hypothetical protein
VSSSRASGGSEETGISQPRPDGDGPRGYTLGGGILSFAGIMAMCTRSLGLSLALEPRSAPADAKPSGSAAELDLFASAFISDTLLGLQTPAPRLGWEMLSCPAVLSRVCVSILIAVQFLYSIDGLHQHSWSPFDVDRLGAL